MTERDKPPTRRAMTSRGYDIGFMFEAERRFSPNTNSTIQGATLMGKGDQRSRRGKIWRGTFGKRRPKKSNSVTPTQAAAPEPEKKGKKQAESSEPSV